MRASDDALLGVLASVVEITPTDFALRVARVTNSGVAPPDWTLEGVVVTRLAAAPNQFESIADGLGGCYSAWIAPEGAELRVRVQHLDSRGRVREGWPLDGLLVGRPVWGSFLKLVRDGGDGLLVLAVTADQNGRPQHHAVRLSEGGTFAHGWGPEWVQLTFEANSAGSSVSFDLSDVVVMADRQVHLVGTRNWECDACEPLSSGSDAVHTVYGEGGRATAHFNYLRTYFSSSFGSIHPLPDGGWYAEYSDGPGKVVTRRGAVGSEVWTLAPYNGVRLYGILYPLDGFDFVLGDDSWVSRRGGDGAVIPGWEGFSLEPYTPGAYWLRPVLSDGLGGAFMVWSGYARNPAGYDSFVRAHHIPAGGEPAFDAGSAPLSISSFQDVDPRVVMLHCTRSEPGAVIVVWYQIEEADGARILAQKVTLDASVPTRAHFVSSRMLGEGVELTWFVSGDRAAAVHAERRGLEGDWTFVGTGHVDGRDLVLIRDHSARSGESYEYRIQIGGRVIAQSGLITLRDESAAPSMLLLGPGARGELRMQVVNPDAAQAVIEAFDVSGRRLGMATVGGLFASELALPLSGESTGLCFLRLRCESGTVLLKASILR